MTDVRLWIATIPFFLMACSAERGPGSLEQPVKCASLFGQSYDKGTKGVCAMKGVYDHGSQVLHFDPPEVVGEIFVEDTAWVNKTGQNSHSYFVTAIYRFDQDGFVTIEEVFSSLDLTAREGI